MKKVLVTGGLGKLGNRMFNDINLEYQLIFTTKQKPKECNNSNCTYIKTDLTHKDGIDKNLWGANQVLHMAGATHEKDQKNYFKVNSEVTKRLIKLAEENGIKRFIYLSSQAVGKTGGSYSHSKEIAENHLESSKLSWTIVRPSEIYGVDFKSSVNELCDFIKKSRIVPIVGNGNYTINPLHIDDFIDFMKRLLYCESGKSYSKKYTLAGPEPIKFNEFCKSVSNFYDKKILKIYIPISICKIISIFLRKFNLSKLTPDQIDRLVLIKNNDITLAAVDYSFKPTKFPCIGSI